MLLSIPPSTVFKIIRTESYKSKIYVLMQQEGQNYSASMLGH